MRKGMLASIVMAVLITAVPAAFADQCPCVVNFQGPGDDFQVFSGNAKTGYLGVEVQDITSDRVAPLKLKEESGVEVTAVDPEAPAAKAGVRDHDVILAINGQKMESEEQLRRVIRETPAGRTITLQISRDGQPLTVKTTLAGRKAPQVWVGKVNPKIHVAPVPPMPPQTWNFEMPDMPEIVMVNRTSRIGAMVENLTPQLADFFGVKDGAGLLVRSVEKGSAAEAAGLKAGDVITKVDNNRINDVSDWRRLIRTKSGNVPISVMRDKREQSLTVKLPERKEQGALNDEDIYEYSFDAQKLRDQLEKEMPKIREEQRIAMLKAQEEVNAHRDEITKAAAEAQREYEKEMKKMQKDLQKMKVDLDKQFKMISYD